MFKIVIDKYNKLSLPVKASVWFLICSFIQKGIAIITTPIFTRLLNTAEFGDYNVFLSWESIIIIFVSFNLSYGVFSQGLVKFEEDRKKFCSSMQGLTLLLFVLWFLLYLFFRRFFNSLFQIDTLKMCLMFVIMWSTSVFGFWAAEQRVEFKYKKLIIITIIVSILNPFLGIILVKLFKDKVLGRILGSAIVFFVIYLWLFIVQMRNGKVFYSKKYWGHALKFNLPLIPHYLSQTVLNSSDRIMIKNIVGAGVAGIYSLAYSLSLIMMIFNNSLMSTISPWMYKKIKENRIDDISKVAYGSLLLIAGVNLCLIAFAPEAVKLFAPKEYYDAIYIIPPVAMSVYFMYAYDLFAKFEFYFEKTKMIASATVIGAILNIIFNFIFIMRFGYIAAGYTTLFCYVVYAVFHYIMMQKICSQKFNGNTPYKLEILLIITFGFLILGFTFLAFYSNTILRYSLFAILLITCILKKEVIVKYFKNILLVKKEN